MGTTTHIEQTIKKYRGWLIVAAVAIAPIILWLLGTPRIITSTAAGALSALGRIAGLTGMTLFAVNVILSARLKVFDRLFHGLNKLYAGHHRLGVAAFISLLLHPTLLAIGIFTFAPAAAFKFIFSFSNPALNFGKLSLISLTLLLIFTLFIPLRYRRWRFSHKFLGLALFLGGLHVFFIGSDLARNKPLTFYLFGLTITALAVYVYNTLLAGRWRSQISYRIETVKRLAPDIIEITLAPADAKKTLRFAPGQFAFLGFDHPLIEKQSHPFSMISSPRESKIRFAIKEIGDFTHSLRFLTPGAMARIEGPYGQFYSSPPKTRQIWIAGGIGITPFLSMLTKIADHCSIDFFYCTSRPENTIYREMIVAFAARHAGLRFFPIYADTDAPLTAVRVKDISGDLKDVAIYLCAPPAMTTDLRRQFRALHVPRAAIYSEEFRLAR